MKKMKEKYKDQDEEEKEMIMQLLGVCSMSFFYTIIGGLQVK